MAEHASHEGDHADVHREESDVNIRAIFGFGAGLAALGAVVAVVVWLLFGYLTRREDITSGARAYPLAAGQEERLPPEPRLQTNPKQDLKDLRAAEDDTLNNYRWVDRNAGVVRIPIDEAMRLTLQRGLPARQLPQEVSK
jgi:hypothetical protein